jgi:signal transduction histidine kinase
MWLNERRKVFQRDENQIVTQYIAIVQDITDRKEAEARKTENEVLNQIVEKKEEFISVASHELKTPITTIKASIQILKRLIQNHSDENTLLVFVIKATQQVNRLMSLISDLLDNTGFKEGKLHLNLSTFDFANLLEEIVQSYVGQRAIEIENPLNIEIEADEVRLGQVINNLLSNAIKYSPPDVPVRVITSASNGMLKVEIIDQGRGIAPEKVEHLFDRFYRVDEKLTEVSGLGLGLYIVSEIIKLHHGKYGVTSELGKGSNFWFEIPIKQGS